MDPNEDHMQELHPQEVDIPAYQIRVQKIVGISSSRIMLRVHHSRSHDIGTFQYFTPWQDLSNSFSIDPDGDHMQMLHHLEAEVPTYHFVVHKTIGI